LYFPFSLFYAMIRSGNLLQGESMICKTLLLATSLWLASTVQATDSLALSMPLADSATDQALPDSIPPLPPPDTVASLPLVEPSPDSSIQPRTMATVATYPADWPEPRKKKSGSKTL